jgi:hypothetical protein
MIKKLATLLIMFAIQTGAVAQTVAPVEIGLGGRVSIIRSLSAQIVEAKKHPAKDVKPAMVRLVDDAWLNEIKSLEAYCLKQFGKTVFLAPFLPDDATNAERPAEGEDGVPAGQIKDYRKFKHRAEFVEDRLQKIAIPECK